MTRPRSETRAAPTLRVDRAVEEHRVLGRVALGEVGPVEADEVPDLLALDVDHAQDLAAGHLEGGAVAGGDLHHAHHGAGHRVLAAGLSRHRPGVV
jgi:hypothetical protein